MHFSQVCLVTLECLLHFVNPAFTLITAFGKVLSSLQAKRHHTILPHKLSEHYSNTILCLAQGVESTVDTTPLILRMWTLSYYYPLSYPPSYYPPQQCFLTSPHFQLSCPPYIPIRSHAFQQMRQGTVVSSR